MDRSKKMPYSSEELVNLYNNTSSGHYFDRDTMRFFKSRVTSNFKRVDDNTAFFITTEKAPCGDAKRLATVRKATIVNSTRQDGDLVSKVEIETVDDFNKLSLYRAKTLLKGL